MSKKKRQGVLPKISDNAKKKVVKSLIEKYGKYLAISEDLVVKIVEEKAKCCETDGQLKELSERSVLMKLFASFAEDIDSEILFIEDARSNINRVVRMVMAKQGKIAQNCDLQAGELLFTEAYTQYQGEENFFNYYVKYLRDRLSGKINDIKDNDSSIESKADDNLQVVTESTNQMALEVQETNNQPVKTISRGRYKRIKSIVRELKDLPDSKYSPTAEEILFRELDLGNVVKTRDYQLLRYIALRYGYWNNKYYSDTDVAEILQLSDEEVLKYQRYSMNLLKSAISSYIQAVGEYHSLQLKMDVEYKNAND